MKSCPACNTRYDDRTAYCTKDGTQTVDAVVGAEGDGTLVGQVIGDRYRITRKLGEGGMGEVYAAEHIHIEKRVAIKLLRVEVGSNAEAVKRFRQEARSASSIGHENIIQIDDFGTLPDGRVYMAMEYLAGAPLSDMLVDEPLPLPRALDILIQTCKGLAAAHAKGIVHRDMKPENVYVTQKDGRDVAKILDFGIAKVSGGHSNQNLTQTGTIYGTPFYMAPEQALGGKTDHRVDVYAMGIILYEVFTGNLPFRAETFMGILTQHITVQAPPPAEQAVANGRVLPPALEQVILKAIRKNANERYQTISEVATALREVHEALVGPRASAGLGVVPPPRSSSQFVPVPTGYVPAVPGTGPLGVTPVPARGASAQGAAHPIVAGQGGGVSGTGQVAAFPTSAQVPALAPGAHPAGASGPAAGASGLAAGASGPAAHPASAQLVVSPMSGAMPLVPGATPSSGLPPAVAAPSARSRGLLVAGVLLAGLVLGVGGVAGWYFLAGPGHNTAQAGPGAVDPSIAGAVVPGAPSASVPATPAATAPAASPPVAPGGASPQPGSPGATTPGGTPPTGATGTPSLGGTTPTEPPSVDKRPSPVDDTRGRVNRPALDKASPVLVDSIPRGAELYVNDRKVGETPFNVLVTPGRPMAVVLRRGGFKDGELTVDGAEKKVTVRLDRIRRKPRQRPRRDGGVTDDGPKPDPVETKPKDDIELE